MIRLFRVFIPTSVLGLVISEIILTIACYIFAYRLLGNYEFEVYFLLEDGGLRTAIVVATLVFGIYWFDLYEDVRVNSALLLYQQFCLITGTAFIVQALLGYFDGQLPIPRWQMLIGSFLFLILVPAWRLAYAPASLKLLGQRRVIFLGANELVGEVASHLLRRPQAGYIAAGYLAPEAVDLPDLGPYLGPPSRIRDVYSELKPALVAVGFSERRGQMPIYDLLDLRLHGAQIQEASELYELVKGRVSLRALRPSMLVFSDALGPRQLNVALQRVYSFLIALVGIVVALPVMLVVALLVRLTSRGPALYRQPRVGLHGSVFKVLKFRSMYADAEARTGAVWARKDDPRVTPVGRWIRRYRLDELPQLFNVLRGEMAIVGPRPERPEFVATLTEQIPFYGQRHFVKPGITGWAQINHKYGDTLEDTITKLEYDLYYLKNLSLSIDLYIMFHTAKVMLLTRGSQ
ncbi:MAG TPA: sugar transferase [Aggregatilineaceae bacterium]|nr:sugar transferase [Aggregatilineaceae bacterium]